MNIQPFALCIKKNGNAVFEWISARRRAHYAVEMIPHKAVQHFLERLKAGDALCIFSGSRLSITPQCFLRHFLAFKQQPLKKPLNTLKRPMQQPFPSITPDYLTTKVINYVWNPALSNFPTGDALVDATRLNQVIESFTREAPEQYLWQHRRFKNRPEGEKSFY